MGDLYKWARHHASPVEVIREEIDSLLAVIHRDGGHYTNEVGLLSSLKRAQDLSAWRIVEQGTDEEETLP